MQIFKTFSREHAPGPPKSRFCYLSCLKYLRRKNCAWKSDEICCPLPEKISEYAPDMKQFKRTYLRPFTGLNVFVFS